MSLRTDSATCANCQTLFENVEVEYDEDGGYAAIQVTPCTACTKLLCSSCDWANCDGCGDVFCADCLQLLADCTLTGLHCCKECVRISEEFEQLPLTPILQEVA